MTLYKKVLGYLLDEIRTTENTAITVCVTFPAVYNIILDLKKGSHNVKHVDLFTVVIVLNRKYLHKLRGLHRMEETYSQMLVFIVHCYHIKANNFRHSKHDRNNPYQSYFDCCPHRNANAFDSFPGHYSSVPAESTGKCYGLEDVCLMIHFCS